MDNEQKHITIAFNTTGETQTVDGIIYNEYILWSTESCFYPDIAISVFRNDSRVKIIENNALEETIKIQQEDITQRNSYDQNNSFSRYRFDFTAYLSGKFVTAFILTGGK